MIGCVGVGDRGKKTETIWAQATVLWQETVCERVCVSVCVCVGWFKVGLAWPLTASSLCSPAYGISIRKSYEVCLPNPIVLNSCSSLYLTPTPFLSLHLCPYFNHPTQLHPFSNFLSPLSLVSLSALSLILSHSLPLSLSLSFLFFSNLSPAKGEQ